MKNQRIFGRNLNGNYMNIQNAQKPNRWYKNLWFGFIIRLKWNWPISRHIYSWYIRRYSKKFAKFISPVIKNLIPSNINMQDLVKIQFMDLPPALIFPMDFNKATRKWWQFWKK